MSHYLMFSERRIPIIAPCLFSSIIKLFQTLWKCSETYSEWFRKWNPEKKNSSTKTSKTSKWYYMKLLMQGKRNDYFGLQKVMYFQQFNINFEQIIQVPEKYTVAFVNCTRNISPQGVVCTWVWADLYASMMKRKNEKKQIQWRSQNVFNEWSYSS